MIRFIEHFCQLAQAEFLVIDANLKIFSTIIDQFPFWVTENGFENFQEQQQTYRHFHQHISAMLSTPSDYQKADFEAIVRDLAAFRRTSSNHFAFLVERALESVGHDQILEKTLNVHRIFRMLNSERPHSELIEYRHGFENAFKELVAEITRLKKTLMNNFQLEHLNHSILQKFNRIESYHDALKLYHETHALKEALKNFQSLKNDFQFPVVPITSHLAKEAYGDFILLAYLIKSDRIGDLLRQYKGVFQFKCDQVKKNVQFLRTKFNERFFEVVRIQRIIDIYKYWERVLDSHSLSQTSSNDLKHMIQLQRLLTYEKKAVFQYGFANQILHSITESLNAFTEAPANRNKNAVNLLANLIISKNQLRRKVFNRETQLKSHYRGLQRTLFTSISTIILGALQHPEYQLGRFTSEFMDHMFTQTRLPIMNEPLSKELKNQVGHATGFSVLLTSLLFSTRLGYSYQLVSTITRIPLAQIDLLFRIGAWLDSVGQHIDSSLLAPLENLSPTQLSSLFEQSRNLMRWDELGVIEKDALLQWITGLCVHLMLGALSGAQTIIPFITGYMAATGCREATGWLTKKVTQKYNFHQESSTFAQIMVHITAYTCAYPYGYIFGNWLFNKSQPSGLSVNKALNILGLHSSATEEDVRKQFRQLALQNHPDKCATQSCSEKMTEINHAYELLTKKMQ